MTPDEIAFERDQEYWAPAYWCPECGAPEYIGTPDDGCTRCGHRGES